MGHRAWPHVMGTGHLGNSISPKAPTHSKLILFSSFTSWSANTEHSWSSTSAFCKSQTIRRGQAVPAQGLPGWQELPPSHPCLPYLLVPHQVDLDVREAEATFLAYP